MTTAARAPWKVDGPSSRSPSRSPRVCSGASWLAEARRWTMRAGGPRAALSISAPRFEELRADRPEGMLARSAAAASAASLPRRRYPKKGVFMRSRSSSTFRAAPSRGVRLAVYLLATAMFTPACSGDGPTSSGTGAATAGAGGNGGQGGTKTTTGGTGGAGGVATTGGTGGAGGVATTGGTGGAGGMATTGGTGGAGGVATTGGTGGAAPVEPAAWRPPVATVEPAASSVSHRTGALLPWSSSRLYRPHPTTRLTPPTPKVDRSSRRGPTSTGSYRSSPTR